MRAELEFRLPPLAPGRALVPINNGMPPPVREGEKWRGLVLLLASSLTIMAGATIAPSLPALEARFAGQGHAALLTRLVLTMPALFIALCAPLAGLVADRWGRRPLLLSAVALYGVAGLSGLVLDTLPSLLMGRALLGVAVAGVMTATTALVGDYFLGAARSRFMGLQAGFTSLGGIVFLTVGGVLAESHWRAPFAIYGLSLILLPAIALFLAEPPAATRRGEVGPSGETSGAALWVGLAGVFFAAVANSVAFYAMPTQLPFFLHALGVPEPSRAGLAIGMVNVVSAIMAFAYTRVRARLGLTLVFAFGFALLATGLLLTARAGGFGDALGAMAMVGAGLGLIMPNLASAALQKAPARVRGRVSGGLTASIFIGQFISPIITQPAIATVGYAATYAWLGGMVGLVAFAALCIFVGQRFRTE